MAEYVIIIMVFLFFFFDKLYSNWFDFFNAYYLIDIAICLIHISKRFFYGAVEGRSDYVYDVYMGHSHLSQLRSISVNKKVGRARTSVRTLDIGDMLRMKARPSSYVGRSSSYFPTGQLICYFRTYRNTICTFRLHHRHHLYILRT